MIHFNEVSKVYDNNHIALSSIDINIEKGEFVFLVGPSGAGKSTFIKLLLKEIEPTTGEIIVNKTIVNNMTRKDIPFYRREIGVVFQDFRLLDNKTVFENVAFAMEIVEANPTEINDKVLSVLYLVGLSEKIKQYPNELSGGEQQRVSLARALVNSPDILICDEPTGNLDPEMSWEIMNIIEGINEKGTTIVMATHAKDIVDKMQKRVIAIEKGRIVKDEKRGVYSYES